MSTIFITQILLSGFVSGIIIFQSFLAAPIVFSFLEKDQSRIFIRKIFPRIFILLASTGFFMLVLNFFSNTNFKSLYVVGIITFLLPVICFLMVPATNNATDNNNQPRFKILHRLSVLFTLLVLIVNLIIPFLI